jgi:hypothetical protein
MITDALTGAAAIVPGPGNIPFIIDRALPHMTPKKRTTKSSLPIHLI